MTGYRSRYRLHTLGNPRSGWAEWGLFLLAVVVGACLLLVLAVHSGALSLPATVPGSKASPPADGAEKAPATAVLERVYGRS
jgi:hypothetical protein